MPRSLQSTDTALSAANLLPLARRYAGPFLLYFSYGLMDAIFQSLIYWIIGALAKDSQILSRYLLFIYVVVVHAC